MKTVPHQRLKTLRIEGDQTIEDAAPLLVSLSRLLKANSSPVLDLSAVKECSISTLQLICSASIAAAGQGHALSIASLPASLHETILSLGLERTSPFDSLHQVDDSHFSSIQKELQA